jgi:hypothetical protein
LGALVPLADFVRHLVHTSTGEPADIKAELYLTTLPLGARW